MTIANKGRTRECPRMSRLALLLLMVAALLAACSLPESGEDRDSGGNPIAYAAFVAEIERARRPFVAPARCSSACTMLLKPSVQALVCFPADGVLRFHSAAFRGPLDPEVGIDGLNQLLASHYPERLRRWFLQVGPGATRSRAMVEIPVSELAARGEARVCP
jgi:hypothetical protein